MATVKISATLDEKLVTEAKTLVGERGLSRFLNETLALRLQHMRLERLERELAAEYGPIPEEIQREVDAIDWPV